MPKRENIDCAWPQCSLWLMTRRAWQIISATNTRRTTGAFTNVRNVLSTITTTFTNWPCARRGARQITGEEKTSMRFQLNEAALRNEPPTFIIVNRSSNRVSESWKAGTYHYRTGLPTVGKAILAHFAAKSDHRQGAVILHSAYECPTRRVPALQHDLSYLEQDNHQKKMIYRGFKFTQAIVNDISAANQAGVEPSIIS